MVFRWRRPLLLTYHDNYRYGTSLYSGTADMVEKKYSDSLSRTYLRSDRGDLGFSTFAGSNLRGGTPVISSETGTKSSRGSGTNLYDPLTFGYGRSYYNTLRGESVPPSKRSKGKTSSSYYSAEESSKDTKTTSKTSDDLKKTVTTTTTSERWVPLSSYLYPSTYTTLYSFPYSKTVEDISYNYADDYKYKTSSKRNVDALDLNTSSYVSDKFDYNFWLDKCREIQSQLDHVNQWVADAEGKIKEDVVGARNKMQTELTQVTMLIDDTTKYNDEMQRVIKRQAKQITDLHSQYDEINRHLIDVTNNLEKSRMRCQTLHQELSTVRSGLEMANKSSSSTVRVYTTTRKVLQ